MRIFGAEGALRAGTEGRGAARRGRGKGVRSRPRPRRPVGRGGGGLRKGCRELGSPVRVLCWGSMCIAAVLPRCVF